jgi:hypothetical protein
MGSSASLVPARTTNRVYYRVSGHPGLHSKTQSQKNKRCFLWIFGMKETKKLREREIEREREREIALHGSVIIVDLYGM